MVCMYFTTVCITVCIPVCTVCMRSCIEVLTSWHAAVFSMSLAASMSAASEVVRTHQRQGRPKARTATSKWHGQEGSSQGSRRTRDTADTLAAIVSSKCSRSSKRKGSMQVGNTQAHEDGSRAQADDFGTGTSNFEGHRCVRKKAQDEFTADPLAPDHSMLRPGA